MLTTTLLCAVMFGAEPEAPVSALDAVDAALLARLPEYFAEPDAETAALYAIPVAKVNGRLITAETVLLRYDDFLWHVRSRKSPQEYAKLVRSIIERDLGDAIGWSLAWDLVETQYPEEHIASSRAHAEFVWEKEKLRLAKELAGMNRSQITVSLDSIKEGFLRKAIFRDFLAWKFPNPTASGGIDLVKYRELYLNSREQAKIETAFDFKLEQVP